MLSLTGDFAMTDRLLSKRDLKQIVLYSPQHIARLEKAGRFPKRVRLGPYAGSRVGWLEVGQSFLVRDELDALKASITIRGMNMKGGDRRYATRKVVKGLRIWRVK